MEFSEYIKKRLPNYREEVPMEKLEELSKLYVQYIFWKQTEDKLLKLCTLDSKTSFLYQQEWLHVKQKKCEFKNLLETTIVQIESKKEKTKNIGIY